MRTFLAFAADAVRAIPDRVADACDRWLMRVHAADMETRCCRWCHRGWPCIDFGSAAGRYASRHGDPADPRS